MGNDARSVPGVLIMGGIGFAIGFFGPMVLDPTGNQGPLVGIVISGRSSGRPGVLRCASRAGRCERSSMADGLDCERSDAHLACGDEGERGGFLYRL